VTEPLGGAITEHNMLYLTNALV